MVILTGRYILAQSERKQPEILEDKGEEVQILIIIIFADIGAVQQDLSFCRVIQAAQQFYESGFARAVRPDQRLFPAGVQCCADVLQRV